MVYGDHFAGVRMILNYSNSVWFTSITSIFLLPIFQSSCFKCTAYFVLYVIVNFVVFFFVMSRWQLIYVNLEHWNSTSAYIFDCKLTCRTLNFVSYVHSFISTMLHGLGNRWVLSIRSPKYFKLAHNLFNSVSSFIFLYNVINGHCFFFRYSSPCRTERSVKFGSFFSLLPRVSTVHTNTLCPLSPSSFWHLRSIIIRF